MRSLDEFEKKIGYRFKNRNLLITALTHSSYANESRGGDQSYERLEFLGDSGFSCGFEDRAAGSDLVGHAVDLNIYHIHAILNFLPYFFSMAPNLHFSRQTPHLMHFCVSMTCGSRTVPEIAPTGQLRAQSVQPLHLSASMT